MNARNPNSRLPLVRARTLSRSILLVLGLASWILPNRYAALGQTPGSLDKTFIKGAGADGFVRVVTVQSDGKILAGGNSTLFDGATSPLIARLNPDGTPDAGFTSAFPSPVLAARIYTMGVQTDGRILAAGLFTNVGGTFRTNIARFETDGSLDASFNAGGGPSGLVRILVVQPDGRILIGGEFTSVNNTTRNRIARLKADGSLDPSFDPGAGADNIVRSVSLLASGQILVGGLFTTFDGRPSSYLVRLNSSGNLDTSFPAGGSPNNNVYFVAPEADGALWIGGDFTAVNGTNLNRIARLRADGSVDSTFTPVGGVVGGPVYHILRQNNGKIVIAGGFTEVDGVPLNRVARLNVDGSLDAGFNPGGGASDLVLSLALQSDGRVVLGGLFTTYDGTTAGMIARIYGDPAYPVMAAEHPSPGLVLLSWPSWAASYTPQVVGALPNSGWQTLTNTPVLQVDRLTVTLPSAPGAQFFRLISN